MKRAAAISGAAVAIVVVACQRAPSDAVTAASSGVASSAPLSASASASASAADVPSGSASAVKMAPRGDGCWGVGWPEAADARLDLVAKRCARGLAPIGSATISGGDARVSLGVVPAGACVRVVAATNGPTSLEVFFGDARVAGDRSGEVLVVPSDGVTCARAASSVSIVARPLASAVVSVHALAFATKPLARDRLQLGFKIRVQRFLGGVPIGVRGPDRTTRTHP